MWCAVIFVCFDESVNIKRVKAMQGKWLIIVGTFIISQSLISCANVQAWEKGGLSKKEMQFNALKVRAAMDTHFYYSKEGSSGGEGFSGGGCGCN